MTLLKCLDTCNDNQIKKLIGGRKVEIKYRNKSPKRGIVTNFISAAIADDETRTIIGFILSDTDEIIITEVIESISIID